MAHGGNVWQGASPGEWLDFSANIRPEGTPDWVKEAVYDALQEARYYPDVRMRREREALGRYLGLDPSCVLPTAGGVSALDLALSLPSSTGVVLTTPCFSEYEELSRRHAHPVRHVPMLSRGRVRKDLVECLGGELPGECLLCLGNPNNPLGTVFSPGEMEALLERVEDAGGWLIVDEAFIEYSPDCSVRGLIPAHEKLIVAGSMTKILGIPGVRLGYLCAQGHVLKRLAGRQLTWEVNCFAGAVLRALPDHGEEIRLDGEKNARRREALAKVLASLGIHVYDSGAAYVLARFDRPVAPVAEALKQQGILVRECGDFAGIDDGRHLRLAVKDEAANEKLINALREVLS